MFSVSLLSLLIVVTTAHSPVTKDTCSLFSYIVKLERTVAVLSTKLEAIEARVRENKAVISTKISKKEVVKKFSFFEEVFHNVSRTQALQKTDVAFQVSLVSNLQSVPDNVAIKFPSVHYNKGDGFSQSSGIFTAPVSGTYLFWAHIMAHDRKRLHVYIRRNGHPIARSHTDGGHIFEVPSISTVAFLDKGDQVSFMKFGPSSSLRGAHWSNYGGVLIRIA